MNLTHGYGAHPLAPVILRINCSENQAKFVQQRVTEVESFFGDLCAELVSYTRRTAKLRNNGK